MALLYFYKSRGITKDFTMLDGSGTVITPGENDVIRIRIGREGKLNTSPLLVVSSSAPTSGGSTFTKNYPTSGKNRLRLDDSDMASLPAGIFTLEFSLTDNADANDVKNVSRQVVCIEDT